MLTGRFTKCVLTAAIWMPALFAQSYQGGIRGRVVDPAGAAIAGACGARVNQDSNASLSTVSNDEGEYAFPALNPARYVLTVEHTGFKRFEQRDITVAMQAFHTVDVSLQVGEVTQSVEVSGESPLMETVIPSV